MFATRLSKYNLDLIYTKSANSSWDNPSYLIAMTKLSVLSRSPSIKYPSLSHCQRMIPSACDVTNS